MVFKTTAPFSKLLHLYECGPTTWISSIHSYPYHTFPAATDPVIPPIDLRKQGAAIPPTLHSSCARVRKSIGLAGCCRLTCSQKTTHCRALQASLDQTNDQRQAAEYPAFLNPLSVHHYLQPVCGRHPHVSQRSQHQE